MSSEGIIMFLNIFSVTLGIIKMSQFMLMGDVSTTLRAPSLLPRYRGENNAQHDRRISTSHHDTPALLHSFPQRYPSPRPESKHFPAINQPVTRNILFHSRFSPKNDGYGTLFPIMCHAHAQERKNP